MKKKSRSLVPVLLLVIVIQSIFILSSFNEKEKEEDVQSYRIERKYYNGQYFYVLVSGGEAKGFLRE